MTSEDDRLPDARSSASHDSMGWKPTSSAMATDGSRPWRPSTSLEMGNISPPVPGTVTRLVPMPV